MARAPAVPASWHPTAYNLAELSAVRAVAAGTADEFAQRRAIKWIIEKAAGTYEPSYRGDAGAETFHAEGRRYVGMQIVKLLNMPADVLEALRKADV